MIVILIISALLSLYLTEYRSAIVLWMIVLFNAIIWFTQEYKASKIIESLQLLIHPQCKINRGGKLMEVNVSDLVPGDICVLHEGDAIPADCRVIQSKELSCNDFALTGESNPVYKFTDPLFKQLPIGERHNMLFMWTTVATGSGLWVVVAIAKDTVLWQIAQLSQETQSDISPLQKELTNISQKLTIGTLIVWVCLFFIALAINLSTYEAFLFALGIAMSLVPQWLPAQISIALSLASGRLAKQKVIVKQLSSVETLWSTTIICTDKTGTLTKNEMTVQQIFLPRINDHALIDPEKSLFNVTGTGYRPLGNIVDQEWNPVSSQRVRENKFFFLTWLLASNANISWPDKYHPTRHTIGDPTEWALITLAQKAGFEPSLINQKFQEIKEFPFDSERKMMSSMRKHQNEYYIFVKWSPEAILHACTKLYDPTCDDNTSGQDLSICTATWFTEQTRQYIIDYHNQQASHAMRNLAFAYKKISLSGITVWTNGDDDSFDKSNEYVESDLVFLWIVSIIDPPREEVRDAMKNAYKAHIAVTVITGDYAITAQAIAKQVWIDEDGKPIKIIKGSELTLLSDDQIFSLFADNHIIFSRTSPQDKLRIVSLLKDRGQIVAVTGDGINDAPALKKADIGVAMWLTGTDVAKESASLILLEDNFSHLVYAIREGRIIFENLKKIILSSLTSNGGELFVVLLSLLGAWLRWRPIAITPILILCIDLVWEMLPLTALARDPERKNTMTNYPRNPQAYIMQWTTIRDLLRSWFLMWAIPYLIFLFKIHLDGNRWSIWNLDISSLELGGTVTYLILLMCQYANILSRRVGHESIVSNYIFSNKRLIISIFISLALVCCLFYIPIISSTLGTWPIALQDRWLAFGWWLLFLIIRELQKYYFRRKWWKEK